MIFKDNNFTMGYALNINNEKICFFCCGELDQETMRKDGVINLYFTHGEDEHSMISNWSGSFKTWCIYLIGDHNWRLKRYDVWFTFEGYWWHGVTIGDNTQVCHCKKTKKKNNR